MDCIHPRELDFAVDLELGSHSPVSDPELAKTYLGNVSINGEGFPEDVKLLIDTKVEREDTVDVVEKKKIGKEKFKKSSSKKPPKPPLPPRGVSLDAADQKLIKEIAQIAMIKRLRIERMKALRKMKAVKGSSSSNGNLFAMLFTMLFCLIILFQA